MVEADLVDCMVAMPGQLFYTTQIPVCLWFLARDKQNGKIPRPARRGAVHRCPQDGHLVDRTHRELTDEDIGADRRHLPRLARREGRRRIRRCAGLLQGATLDEIRKHGYVLTPGAMWGPK